MKLSILSDRSAKADSKIKSGGKIRCGIKLLTKKAMESDHAKQLYAQGVERRLKFSEIEKEITRATGIANPLYPRNSPYFRASASDFAIPEFAQHIVNRYGEIQEEHSRRMQLYRFPIIFHSNELEEIYPNKFQRYGAEPAYESVYKGNERLCQFLPIISAEELAAQRARRQKRFPRREPVVRGACDPNLCQEFLAGQCRFRGTLYFYIPEVRTPGPLSMDIGSEYSAQDIWNDLSRIRDALGYLPKMHPDNPELPAFYIAKVAEQRAFYDEHGQRQVGIQWVPKLQCSIDIGLLIARASSTTALTSSTRNLPLVSGHLVPQQETQLAPMEEIANLSRTIGVSHQDTDDYLSTKVGEDWASKQDSTARALAMLRDLTRVGHEAAGYLIRIANVLHLASVSQTDFCQYAATQYGKGYTRNTEILAEILGQITALYEEEDVALQAFIASYREPATRA